MNEPIEIKYQGKIYWGYKESCPTWLKNKFIARVGGKCQDCGNTENLEIHRCKRGVEQGLYIVVPLNHPLNNCKVLCHECHEKYNYSRKLNYQFTIKK